MTNSAIRGIKGPMWPGETGRDFCIHAYRSPHPIDRNNWFYICRLCGDIITLKFDVEKGQIIDNVFRKRIKSIEDNTQEDAI